MRDAISIVVGLVAATCLGVGYVEILDGGNPVQLAAGLVLGACAFQLSYGSVSDRG